MKLGLFVASQWPEGADLSDQCALLCDQVRAARDNGFSSIWAAQHWLVGPMRMFQPTPLLARLMAAGEGLMFGPGVMLVSMQNPVIVAEDAATLDWLCGGRYVLAGGMGYRAEEFEGTGTNPRERVSRTVEAVEVMRKLWSGERISHQGRHFRFENVQIGLAPKRPIPVWLGASVEKSVARAARVADAWLPSMSPPLPQLVRLTKHFHSARSAAGLAAPAEQPLCREVYVGANRDTAFDEVRPYLEYKYAHYAAWGSNNVAPDAVAAGLDEFANDRFIIGDAESVAQEIDRYRTALGTNHLICRMQWPGMPQDLVLSSIERLGKAASMLD